MKTFCMLILWMFLTLILTLSIIGMLLFIQDGVNPSTWMSIGRKLTDKIINDK